MAQIDIPTAYQTIKTKLEAIVARKHYTKTENDTQLATKQNTLVSGTNIKTINNNSLLGSGNISISSGNVDSTMSTTSTNALQNKIITNVVKYKITASDYNPTIDSTVTITVTAYNQANNTVSSHSCTLTLPNGTTTSLTTDSNGVATYTYTCSSWGLQTFLIGTTSIQIRVKGFKTNTQTGLTTYYNENTVSIVLNTTKNLSKNIGTNWADLGINLPSGLNPKMHQFSVVANDTVRIRANINGKIQYQSTSAQNSVLIQCAMTWAY